MIYYNNIIKGSDSIKRIQVEIIKKIFYNNSRRIYKGLFESNTDLLKNV